MVFGNVDWSDASVVAWPAFIKPLYSCSSATPAPTPPPQRRFSLFAFTMLWARSRQASVAGLILATLFSHPSLAQSTDPKTGGTSRAQLVARARAADSLGLREEAFQLRTRLEVGDFEVGDRVLFSLESIGLPRAISDTLVVQSGRILRLAEPLGDLRLTGLLISELRDSVVARVKKYYKDPVIRVDPLLRLSLSGAVNRAGFYYAANDLPLGDLIMRTGGQAAGADLRNVTIRRGDRVLWSAADVQSALADGLTLQQLGLEPGDEVVVGAQASASRWLSILQYGLPLVAAIVVPLLIRR